jgi:hypothetical protein
VPLPDQKPIEFTKAVLEFVASLAKGK